jgi:hypothetical protein
MTTTRAHRTCACTMAVARAPRCSSTMTALSSARGNVAAVVLTDVREAKARSTASARGEGSAHGAKRERAGSTPLSRTSCLINAGPVAGARRHFGRQSRGALRGQLQARALHQARRVRNPTPSCTGRERCAQPAPAGHVAHDAMDPSDAARRCDRPVTPPPAMELCEAMAAGLCGCAIVRRPVGGPS